MHHYELHRTSGSSANRGPSEQTITGNFLRATLREKIMQSATPIIRCFYSSQFNSSVSLHYTTFGKEVIDQTVIGLYLADEEPRFEYSTYALVEEA